MDDNKNVVWHGGQISREDRIRLLGKENKVIWFTGLSASGKSTLAHEFEKHLHESGTLCYVLDGDNVRHGLNADLGFTESEREENIRRISEVTKLFYDAGFFVLVSFISPYKKDRDKARKLIGKDFVEVFVDCPLQVCEERDPKGMYKKAREGIIKKYTGIDDPYEVPEEPEITINTENLSVEESVNKLWEYLNPVGVENE